MIVPVLVEINVTKISIFALSISKYDSLNLGRVGYNFKNNIVVIQINLNKITFKKCFYSLIFI